MNYKEGFSTLSSQVLYYANKIQWRWTKTSILTRIMIAALLYFLCSFHLNSSDAARWPCEWCNDELWLAHASEFGGRLQRPQRDQIIDIDKVIQACDWKLVTTLQCLEFLETNRQDLLTFGNWATSSPDIYHVYIDRVWDSIPSLMVKSFLFTQSSRSQLWIWMTRDRIEQFMRHPSSQKILPHADVIAEGEKLKEEHKTKRVLFREFRWEVDVTKVPRFEVFKKSRYSVVAQSDIARFALLSVHGGLYFDMDTLLLRDMSDLYHSPHDFAYEWSYHGVMNTAALRIHKENPALSSVVDGAREWQQDMPENIWHGDNPFHPFEILQYLEKSGRGEIKMLPDAVNDPLWHKTEKVKGHMGVMYPDWREFDHAYYRTLKSRPKPLEFFKGAWSYHWHGGGLSGSQMGGWLQVWDSLYDCYLNGVCPNFYGEKVTIKEN